MVIDSVELRQYPGLRHHKFDDSRLFFDLPHLRIISGKCALIKILSKAV